MKKRFFTVRLSVRVAPPPPAPYGQLFVKENLCLYSETDFTQEKCIFIELVESPILP